MLVVAREPPAGTAKTGLDFVGDEQYPGLVTDRARGSEVPVGGTITPASPRIRTNRNATLYPPTPARNA